MLLDLSKDWSVTFKDGVPAEEMKSLHSWDQDAATKYYSGTAMYTKMIHVTAKQAAGELAMDFGEGTAMEADPAVKSGMKALLDAPVRDAAVVRVNGEIVGSCGTRHIVCL